MGDYQKQETQTINTNESVENEKIFHNQESNEVNANFFKRMFTKGQKSLLTFIYCISFWNFGVCVAIFGPTLLDLACQTSSTLSAMSLLYFMQNFTSLIGCFVSGILLKNKKITIFKLLLISTILMPICVALMPLSKHIVVLGMVMSFLGFNMGCIDNIANLGILKLHSTNVSPYIQTMHFFFGVGAFLTPIIVKSFLNSNFDITITSNSFNCYNIEETVKYNSYYTQVNSKNALNHDTSPYKLTVSFLVNNTATRVNPIVPDILMTKTQFTSQTKYAFWILALIQLPAPIFLAMFMNRFENLNQQQTTKGEEDEEENYSMFSVSFFKSMLRNLPFLQMTLLISFLVFLFEGLVASHGSYIFSYAVEKYDFKQTKFPILQNKSHDKMIMNRHHQHHQSDDAYITAIFWAFFSLGRLTSIFLATKFSASFMIFIDIIGCLISAILLLFSSFWSLISLLYVATCLLGLSLSNTTPTIYSLAEIHIGMTPTFSSFVIICAAAGEMVLPVIVANLFESVGPTSLLVIEFILSILAALTFARFFFYAKIHAKNFDSRDSFIWLTSNQPNELNQTEGSNLVGNSSVKYYSRMYEENE